MMRLVKRSLLERHPIEIIYMDSELQCTKRRILVKKVETNYITAYCFSRKDIRKFKIHDILAAFPPLPRLNETFS
ncbi:WYL domain-containing protein [Rossellomorea arthrocnemi]|uniref:WYL domain-containing protein n=1 Tax=Rossellomorea arthrocnemi TaxID=2769542 RepID=UPI001917F9C0|nr:hypothetical protein [Rossellomorea arthrocnemi]